MKAYVCDVCGTMIDDPHYARMREFWFEVSNCDKDQVPMPSKRKEKIHLCNDCFIELKYIVRMKRGEQK